ncbi:exonuclease domain-containing protein [Lachnospiraceae bacterium OttesenSCG-928-D06]|nr:exonuclease domain-containing protein [Lachnospiraceae bacterium OttesenSCG-928-D06]
MNYIVLDLEWNQSNTKQEGEVNHLPFEIIEFGAIKLNRGRKAMLSEFNELVKPQVYHEMHYITSKLIHMQMAELQRGRPFPAVMGDFLSWCGDEEYMFCTWGPTDLTVMQQNMKFYGMQELDDKPIPYLDVQKLFSIAFEERGVIRSLEFAIDFLGIEKDIPFHRAFSDAYYTAKVLGRIEDEGILRNISYDVFHVPKDRHSQVKIQFANYEKFISRGFADKIEAFMDKEVISSKCYYCHRNLRKKVKWFTINGRHYYCLAHCDKHGFLKGKIRIHKNEEGQTYVVKTTKFVNREDAEKVMQRKQHAQEIRRRRNKRVKAEK